MKFILLISAYCYLLHSTAAFDQYNILQDAMRIHLEGGPTPELEPPYKMKPNETIDVNVSKLKLANKTLSYPFMIFIAFKCDEVPKATNLFTIGQTGSDISKLKFTISLVSDDFYRFTLESESFQFSHKKKFAKFHGNLELNQWTNVSLFVEQDKVSFWMYCDRVLPNEMLTVPMEDIIHWTDADQFHLSDLVSQFVGEIQDIIIYTNIMEDEVTKACDGDFSLPDSAGKPAGDHGEALPSPERLRAPFFKNSTDKAERGDGGVDGEETHAGALATFPGTCECSETFSSLLLSMPDMRGPRGEPGPQGEKGEPGPLGPNGEKGERGEMGHHGHPGLQGAEGAPGRDGRPGRDGNPGKDGAAGSPGPPGSIGPPGTCPVIKGTGETKVLTVKGETGARGPRGPEGAKGNIGSKGDKGDQGFRGEKGDRGEVGSRGVEGPPGNIGPRGEKGQKGDNGTIGLPGPAGTPATLRSLLTEELNPEEKAIITDALKGPKGEKGDGGAKGDIGDIGLRGPPGNDGKDGRDGRKGEPGPQGPVGKTGPSGPLGHKGERGEPGLPGNVPLDAIALTKGEKGAHGHPGHPGPAGEPGVRGIQGTPGIDGSKGEKGNVGPQGPIGPKGMEGKQGPTGEKGEKGDKATLMELASLKGEKGDTGQIGPMGPIGPPGPPGPVGNYRPVPGPPGPPGEPGLPGRSITRPKGELAAFNSIYYDNLVGDDDFYTTSTIVYTSVTALKKGTSSTPLGTLAFVLQEEILLVRVKKGWQYVRMGSLWNVQPSSTATQSPWQVPTPTTQRPRADILESLDKPRPTQRLKSNYIRLIALNSPYTGKMLSETNSSYGFYAIRNDCKRQAQKHNIPGNFMPLLNYQQSGLKNLVREQYHHLPVGNVFGDVLYRSWSEMFHDQGQIPPTANIYGFNRRSIFIDPTWPEHKVWHGSNSLEVGQKANCLNWISDSPKNYGVASTLNRNKLLLEELHPCNSRFIVLCVDEAPNLTRRQRHILARRRRKLT